VASHDLQEPLRKVQTFSDRLRGKCGNMLDKTGLDYLRRMQEAAERMKDLINDLLTYSRLTTRPQPFENVDLGQITTEVLSDLEVQIEELDAIVEVAELPAIEASAPQMRRLIQNVVSNALKFHKPNEKPIIKITGRILEQKNAGTDSNTSETRFCQITVEDNGIGFEEKYAERIFGMFQRLHESAGYKGSGMGLAICRKITDRHGGTIIAKSCPNKGSKFIVTLPVGKSRNKNLSTNLVEVTNYATAIPKN